MMRKIIALLAFLGYIAASQLFAQNVNPVKFDWGAEVFPDNFQATPKERSAAPEEVVNGYYYRYIQCTEIPNARQRAALETEGVEFLAYVPFGAYLVALPETFDPARLSEIKVRSILAVPPSWKMARSLREQPWGEWAVHGDYLDVNLQLYPQMRIPDGAAWLRERGVTLLQEGNQNGFLQVRLHRDQLETVAAWPVVRTLELASPPSEPEDDRGRNIHRSNVINADYPTGKHYDGSGVRIMIRDDGLAGPHIDFKNRIVNLSVQNSGLDHGDQVGGVAGGAGNLNPTIRGMASGSTLYFIDYTAEFQDQTLPLHLSENITITNTSYKTGCNEGYTLSAQTVDRQLYENPTLMHLFSGGNEGTANCNYGAGPGWGNISGGHKMSKNSLAVGSIDADLGLSNFSSRGPAHDGRLKPEVVGLGGSVDMPISNHDYTTANGTSYSAPAAAGVLAQLTQAYREITNNDQAPAALLKAILMNTASDLGNPGPDFRFGWGHLNASRALQTLENGYWSEGTLDQGEEQTFAITIPAGTRQARVMLYWSDPPAPTNNSHALINDLDIRAKSPDGTDHLPWKLDPTPNAAVLNSPAGFGRDSINNVEQIALTDPAPGQYTVTVKGFEVPMGPQHFYLVWEFYDDGLTLTYPGGGESLRPGEIVTIQWDAFGNTDNFLLHYSANSGASWDSIASVNGSRRFFNWVAPNITSGQVLFRVTRNAHSDTSRHPVTIALVPGNLQVVRVCPDSMTVSWNKTSDTLRYDVYLLGQQYMEIIGSSDTTLFTFPIQSAGADQWFSVRASHPNGLAGRRALAVNWPGGLKNCQQQDDLAVRSVLVPSDQPLVSCTPEGASVSVRLANDGVNPISGAVLSYQLNGDAPESETLPDLAPGETLDFVFQKPITVDQNGTNTLKIWSTYAPEDALFNDTIVRTFQAVVTPTSEFFTETFQSVEFPPLGWALGNPDNDKSWESLVFNLAGLDGPSWTIWFNCYDYPMRGAEDYLQLPPVNLANLNNPALRFDLAYANYPDNSYNDSLRIEVFANCDLTAPPTVIWAKGGADLATTGATTSSFFPNMAQDWRREGVSLEDFTGQTVLIRMVGVNDFGNNIFLDNIGIFEFQPPVASIGASLDTVCRLDTVYFSALSTDPVSTYRWQFGANALPASANGPGPHSVIYILAGNKNARLIATNPNGADTAFQAISVRATPVANFSWNATGPSVSFTNTSSNGAAYLWDFGDNTTSTEANPVHVYSAPGDYTVKLTATNDCASNTKSQTFNLTFVGARELPEFSDIRILPNPTSGDFQVQLTSVAASEVQLSLFDAQGRLLSSRQIQVLPGQITAPFEGADLPKGLYQLHVQTKSGTALFRVAVQ